MMNNVNIFVGRALRDLRGNAGMTQEQVASKLCAPQSFVSKIETGERALKLSEVYDYAKALDVKVTELVEVVGDQIADGAEAQD